MLAAEKVTMKGALNVPNTSTQVADGAFRTHQHSLRMWLAIETFVNCMDVQHNISKHLMGEFLKMARHSEASQGVCVCNNASNDATSAEKTVGRKEALTIPPHCDDCLLNTSRDCLHAAFDAPTRAPLLNLH